MGWMQTTFTSSIGAKVIVAITGLAMVGFLVGHLAGNLLIFVGPEAIDAYAKGLRDLGPLLWIARIGLVVAVVLHIVYTIRLNLHNKASRPTPYVKKTYQKATWHSRMMVLSGLFLMGYIVYHLLHYTFRVTSDTVASVGPYDVYAMLVAEFSKPLVSVVYILAMIAAGMHLSHGVSSLCQTLGINHPKYNKAIGLAGPALGVGLAVAFSSIPIAVMSGLVK